MNNPYATPTADVDNNELPSKRRWKIFFWIFLVINIASIWLTVIDESETLFDIGLSSVMAVFAVLGVFGYAYHKKILFKEFWGYFLPSNILYELYSVYRVDWKDGVTSDIQLHLIIGISAAIIIPIAYGQIKSLWLYYAKSEDIWLQNI